MKKWILFMKHRAHVVSKQRRPLASTDVGGLEERD